MLKYSFDIVIAFSLVGVSVLAANDQSDITLAADNITQEIRHVSREIELAWEKQEFENAEALANRVIELFNTSEQVQSISHATALRNLAYLQETIGRVRESETNYKKSIQLIELLEGRYSPQLSEVLYDLGILYYKNEDYELSTDAFRRAQHITHRENGVYTLKQLEYVDWLTRIAISTKKLKQADEQQRFFYSINVRSYGEEGPRMLPAMYKLAEWFRSTGQLKEALETHEKALFVIDKHNLRELEKVRFLRGISSVKYLKGSCCAEEQLDKALQIVTSDPDSDDADELSALMHIADMYIIKKQRAEAEQFYRQAWDRVGAENPLASKLFGSPELLGVSGVDDVVNAYVQSRAGVRLRKKVYRFADRSQKESNTSLLLIIGEPLRMCRSRVLELARTKDISNLEQYFVELDFTVTREGRVSNISLGKSNAPGRLKRYVTSALRHYRFRPAFQDGKSVEMGNIKLRQTFSSETSLPLNSAFNRIAADEVVAVSLGCQLLSVAAVI